MRRGRDTTASTRYLLVAPSLSLPEGLGILRPSDAPLTRRTVGETLDCQAKTVFMTQIRNSWQGGVERRLRRQRHEDPVKFGFEDPKVIEANGNEGELGQPQENQATD